MSLINALVGDLFPPEGTTSMALEHHYMQQTKPAWNALTVAEMTDAYNKHAKYQKWKEAYDIQQKQLRGEA